MKLFVAGISYKTASVEVREQLSVVPSKLVCHGCRLKLCGDLDEVVLLSTCNRVEIYGTTPRLTGRIDSLFRLLAAPAPSLGEGLPPSRAVASAGNHSGNASAGEDPTSPSEPTDRSPGGNGETFGHGSVRGRAFAAPKWSSECVAEWWRLRPRRRETRAQPNAPGTRAQPPFDFRPHVYLHEDAAAVGHLFAVASGLDSMVLGETEITGQVKQAYDLAQGARLTGPTLNRLFQKAFQTVKDIRTRTAIGRGATSVGSVAVELAEKIFRGSLADRAVIIVGAGSMGEVCVRHLAKKGTRSVLVSNRSFDRAQALAAEFGGQAVRFEDCLGAMAQADIVVTSTGCPKTLLHRAEVAELMRARRNRPLFLIDISVPRNIDPAVHQLEGVYLYDIDDLETIVRENVRLREQELAVCQEIIAQRTAALMTKLNLDKERLDNLGLQSQPGWLPDRAAVCDG